MSVLLSTNVRPSLPLSVPPVQFRCGYYHTVALALSGRVFACGRNDYGQLGLGHTTQRVYGTHLIPQLGSKSIVRIAAGCYHTVAVGETGALFVFGRNNHGQLGTGDSHRLYVVHTVLTILSHCRYG
jgi:RCC1 and BTB domain-containing protein